MNKETQRRNNTQPSLRTAALLSLAGALALAASGCKSKNPAQIVSTSGQNPADANMAQPYTGGDAGGYGTAQASGGQARVLGKSQAYAAQSSSESFETQAPAPIIHNRSSANESTQYYPVPQAGSSQTGNRSTQQAYDSSYGQGYTDPSAYDGSYSDAEDAGAEALAEADQPPPPLPVYDQPAAPDDNYLWTPGYWNYANAGYYWVPGAWVAPPFYGALWTPPYWGYDRGHYICHRGYWGHHIGYYGGVNYGFGYVGIGYFGGYWRDRNFFYNRAVTNVNVSRVHNVYNRTVVVNNITYGPRTNNYVSYNGGRGGLSIQPRQQELSAMHEAHFAPVAAQRQNRLAAQANRSQFFAANHGRPGEAFAGQPFGNVRTIAAAPSAQPVNHPDGIAAPGFNNSFRNNTFRNNNVPGAPGQPNIVRTPGVAPNRPGPGNNRPGLPNQPGTINGRPAEINRPGSVNQPGFNHGRPGDFNRPGTPNQPAVTNGLPDEVNRPGTNHQPGLNHGRPGTFERPGAPNQPRTNNGRPAEIARPNINNQPGFNGGRPGEGARVAPNVQPGDGAHPGFANRGQPQPGINDRSPAVDNGNRPGRFERPGTPAQPVPNQPAAAPPRVDNFHRNAPVAPATAQPRPDREMHRFPAPSQPQTRPNFEQRPAFNQPRPEVAAPRATAPAPAPRPAAPAPAARPATPTAGPHAGGGQFHPGNGPHGR